MKVVKYSEVELNEVKVDGASGAKIRKVLTAQDGAPTFTMRIFELEKGGHTPLHAHEWEHEIYVIEGNGYLVGENDTKIELTPGKAALIKPNEMHQFKNNSDQVFKFMCLVPNAYA